MIEIEGELRKNNDLLSNMLTASPVGVVTYNETGQCTYANKSAAEITGATRGQLEKQNYHAIESWKKSGLYDVAMKAVKTGKKKEKEVHLTSTFGKEIWISCKFIPFSVKQSGQLLLLIEDVSARKKAEIALKEAYTQTREKVREQTLELKKKNRGLLKEIRLRKEAEEKTGQLNSILTATREINQLITTSKDKQLILSQACRILVKARGLQHAWIVLMNGSSLPEYITHYGIGKTWKTFRKSLEEGKLPYCMREVLNTKTARIITDPGNFCKDCLISQNYIEHGSLIVPLKHEENIYGVISISVSNKFLKNQEELELLQELADDLSFSLSKIGAEEKLGKYHEQQLALFNGIEDLMYVSDPDSYELLYVNPVFIKHWGSDVIGKKCYRVIQNREEPCPFCTNDKIFGKNKGKTYVWEFQNLETRQWYHCADKAILWPDGRWVRFEIATNITEHLLAMGTIKKQSHDLEERVKELECINKILELKTQTDLSLEQALTESVRIILSGWQYPEITCARITFNGKAYVSSGFKESRWNQEAEIIIPGMGPGRLGVFYTVKKPVLDEGPFLKEERNLINTLANLLGNYIRKRQAEEELERKNQEYYSLNEEYEAQNEELRTINEELSGEVSKRRKNEEALERSENELRIRNRLADIFLTVPDEKMYYEVLKVILEVLKSKYGVFGYIDEDGAFVVPTMTRYIWSQCKVADKTVRFPRASWGDTTWPRAIREKKIIFLNHSSKNIPEGHVPIQRHISVPIVHRGRSVGLFQVANKKTDYTEDDIHLAQVISYAIAPVLDARLVRERLEEIRKNTEQSLRESESKYRTLVEHIPQKIFIKDKNYRWVSINENFARDLKIKPEEAVGKVDSDFFPKQLADKYRADDKRIMKTGKTEDIEEQYLQDGEYFWVHTIKTPVRDDKGNITGVFGIFWDITELKRNQLERERLTVELAEKNKELEQVIYITSHDLRSPLVNIQGFSWELEDSLAELGNLLRKKEDTEKSRDKLLTIIDEEIPEALKYINTSIDKMDGLLKGLLSLSRVGQSPLEKKKIDMSDLVREIAVTLDYKIKAKGIQLTIGDLPDCTGDKSQINQVFTNLIDNSIKYSVLDRKGMISVTGWKEGERCVYCFEDNGVGIEKEHLENIFKLFHQLSSSSEGEGIGLAIVKKIVDKHNGNIRVESEMGKGTKFTVTF